MRAGRTSRGPWAACRGSAAIRPARFWFPILCGMSQVVNQTVTHTCPYKHASLPAADKTAGFNSAVKGAQAFEQRATQEQGSH